MKVTPLKEEISGKVYRKEGRSNTVIGKFGVYNGVNGYNGYIINITGRTSYI